MPLFQLTLFDSVGTAILSIPFFIIAKVLTQDWKLNVKESLYIALASLIFAAVLIAHIILHRIFEDVTESLMSVALNALGSAVLYSLLFLYFYKLKAYSAKRSFSLMFFASVIGIIVEHMIGIVFLLTFPTLFHNYELWHVILYCVFISIVAIGISYKLVVMARHLRSVIRQDKHSQIIFVCLAMLFLITVQVLRSFWHYREHPLALLSWNTVFVFGFILVLIVVLYLYTKVLTRKFNILQKDAEEKGTQYYLAQLEQQQNAMQKFKHDFPNILISFEGLLKAGDLSGMNDYYFKEIKPTLETVTKSKFTLARLSAIKVPVIKALLAAKLSMAQNLGIDTAFEVGDEIDHIPIASMVFVRMLGIILDNAIEELVVLGTGTLSVGCFRTEKTVNFVVQNTCRADIPPLRQMEQAGFSTKEEDRGLGLSNLAELVDAEPNITLQTTIEANTFSQRLIISED